MAFIGDTPTTINKRSMWSNKYDLLVDLKYKGLKIGENGILEKEA
jgi:hypothetical protein